MKLPGPSIPQVQLQSGCLLVTREPQWIVTLLGSCVAVTLFNARFHLAAMCHAMLPRPHVLHASGGIPASSFRYVSHAVPAMLKPFHHLGLQPADVEVKIFGGGNVINLGGDPQDDPSIGEANVAMARQLLLSAGFEIKAHSVGGHYGCKLAFNTHTGQVLHKHLPRGAFKP